MKGFCRVLNVFLCSLFVFCLAMPVVASAEMVKKVDNFVVMVDQSGSMALNGARTGSEKFDMAANDVKSFEGQVPDLGYNGALSLFAPYKSLKSMGSYEKQSFGPLLDKVMIPFSHLTGIGDGLSAIGPMLDGAAGKTAVILFTDGGQNEGSSPVDVARKFYSKYDSKVCLHVVSYADTPAGEKVISELKALSDCSVVAEGKALASDAAMKQFAKAVLYDEVEPPPPPKPAAKPAPAPAPAPVAKEVVTFNLLFDFDKSDIKDEMIASLEQAKIILGEEKETTFVISGHTDSTGPEDYNQGLSERRAKAVKDWLVANGVSAARLKTVGYGESRAKYDNATREGRKLNRRVEMQSQ